MAVCRFASAGCQDAFCKNTALQAVYVCHAKARHEARVFTKGFLHSTPARIAVQIQDRRRALSVENPVSSSRC